MLQRDDSLMLAHARARALVAIGGRQAGDAGAGGGGGGMSQRARRGGRRSSRRGQDDVADWQRVARRCVLGAVQRGHREALSTQAVCSINACSQIWLRAQQDKAPAAVTSRAVSAKG